MGIHEQVLRDVFALFQGQAASLVGSAVSANEYGLDTFTDVDVFFADKSALQYGLGLCVAQGWVLHPTSERRLKFTHRWGGKAFHVETYRLDKDGVELNLTVKLLGGKPVRNTAEVLLSFDFGALLVGYDCLADSFEDARLDLRPAFFPQFDTKSSAYPMVPDKRRAWVRGEFGKYNSFRQAERVAKYAMRGYDMSYVVPDLITGYEQRVEDLQLNPTPHNLALIDIYVQLCEHLDAQEWELVFEAMHELDANAELEELQVVFD